MSHCDSWHIFCGWLQWGFFYKPQPVLGIVTFPNLPLGAPQPLTRSERKCGIVCVVLSLLCVFREAPVTSQLLVRIGRCSGCSALATTTPGLVDGGGKHTNVPLASLRCCGAVYCVVALARITSARCYAVMLLRCLRQQRRSGNVQCCCNSWHTS